MKNDPDENIRSRAQRALANIKRDQELQRLVYYEITDADTGEFITPDQITLDNISLITNSRFAPGYYVLQIKRKGYVQYFSKIEIPKGEDPFIIRWVLSPEK